MHMLHDVNEKQEIQVRTIATTLITLHRKHLDSSAAFEWFVCIEVVAFMIFFFFKLSHRLQNSRRTVTFQRSDLFNVILMIE